MEDRVRANTLALAVATLGQSPVMWHAGTDFLRSKSLDRNSYSSGDWFNYLDFTLTDNGFGAGLPPAADNADKWVYMKPLLADPSLKPGPADMRLSHAAALDLLRLRASRRLFRLADAEQIRAKVTFPVSGLGAAARRDRDADRRPRGRPCRRAVRGDRGGVQRQPVAGAPAGAARGGTALATAPGAGGRRRRRRARPRCDDGQLAVPD